jgi:hypothetical protein
MESFAPRTANRPGVSGGECSQEAWGGSQGDGLIQPPRSGLKLSTWMEMEFCVDALQNVIDKYGSLDIFNSVLRGCSPVRLSLTRWPTVLSASFVGGKGRFYGDIFIDRLRHGLKYKELFIQSLHTRCGSEPQRQPAIYLLQRHRPALVSRCQASRELFASLPTGIWTTLPLRCASALTNSRQGAGTTKTFNRRGESGWLLRPRHTDEGSCSWRGPLVLTARISYQWTADRHKIALRPARFPIYERFS